MVRNDRRQDPHLRGGRCNVTHEVVTPTDYFGNRRIIKNVLAAFSLIRL